MAKRFTSPKSGLVHLQGCGDYTGTPVAEVKPGMHILYNYGYTAEVVSVEPHTAQSVKIVLKDGSQPNAYECIKRNMTLVAAFWPKG